MNHPSISRRSLLSRSAFGALALVGTSLAKPTRGLAQSLRAGNPIRFPPEWDGRPLVAEPADIQVWPGVDTPLLALNGHVPAPTIRVRRHHRFAARVENRLSEDFVLHWHGILSPASMDGNPRDAVGPGEGYDIGFRIHQQAGTYWYHAHTDRLTGKQVYLGLAGFFIVEDPAEDRLRLPHGHRDLPLLIQDRRTHGGMHLSYEPEEMDIATGFLGDAVFVNNTPEPWLSVDRSLYRLRLLNGSNARVYRLGFEHEEPFQLIANDAGLLPAPIEVSTVMLAPGQRAEIVVDFGHSRVGAAVVLMSHPFEGGGHGGDGGTDGDPEGHVPPQGAELPVMTFYVDGEGGHRRGVPKRLGRVDPYDPQVVRRTRVFNLGVDGLLHPINGALFDIDRVDFAVPFGELELWEYQNDSDEFHPMHPHGALIQVLERHGMNALPPEDAGWKDTVLVAPGEMVRVLIRYDDHDGPFVHHCHNLEHEDNGMMQNLVVERRRDVRPRW